MEVANNVLELNTILTSLGAENKTVVSTAARNDKKADEVHPGMLGLLNIARSMGDIIVMTYAPLGPMVEFFHGSTKVNISSDVFNKDEMVEYWNLASITPDILYFQSVEDMDKWLLDESKEDVLSHIDQVWADEGWEDLMGSDDWWLTEDRIKIAKTFQCLGWLNRKIDGRDRMWKQDVVVHSNKDGYYRYINMQFMKKYCGYNYVLIDPVKTQEGIPYSQMEFRSASLEERVDLGKIVDMIPSTPVEKLKDKIEKIQPTFRVKKVTSNIVEDRTFIEVLITIFDEDIGERGPYTLTGWRKMDER